MPVAGEEKGGDGAYTSHSSAGRSFWPGEQGPRLPCGVEVGVNGVPSSARVGSDHLDFSPLGPATFLKVCPFLV